MRTWPAFHVAFPAAGSGEPESLQDLVAAALDGTGVTAIDEGGDGSWRVFFSDIARRDVAASTIIETLAASGLTVRCFEADDEDWARRSQAGLSAVRVGRILVAPPWDPAATSPPTGTLAVVIEPSMGFGSGHHATTRLCLDALQQIDLRGTRVIDLGTGSGVLAFAAARLGAVSVLGVDVDADALASARAAHRLNGSPRAVSLVEADFRKTRLPVADVVVANLTGGILAAGATAVLRCCKAGGIVITSGVTAAEEGTVASAFAALSSPVWRGEDEGWVAWVFRRLATGDKTGDRGRPTDDREDDRQQSSEGARAGLGWRRGTERTGASNGRLGTWCIASMRPG
ncbi:MAG: 50S ribosomal protein L11 methyltransferase [Acidobacteriota bacterium]